MIPFKKKNLIFQILLFLFVVIPITVSGQEIQSYSGSKQVGDFKGKAKYSYKVVEGDTILDGPFRMQRSNLEALLEKEDISFLFEGAFREDYPDGNWRFQFGEFASDSASEVVDYQYRVSISGVQEEAKGYISKGRPDGPWRYTVNRIKDSQVEETLFKSSIAFDEGIPQKSFRIEDQDNVLVGRFLRNGLAHDEWAVYAADDMGPSESWSFSDGVLQKIQIQKNDKTNIIPVFEAKIGETKTINLDGRYIGILDLHKKLGDSTTMINGKMSGLLSKNAGYYQKIDTLLSALGKSAFLPRFKVKVPYFPLDSVETAQIDSIGFHFRKSKAISDSLLNNSQLNLLKLSDSESLFFYSVINKISKEFLNPLKRLLDYNGQNMLEFATRNQLINRLWPTGKPSKEIKIVNETDSLAVARTFTLPNANQFNFDGNNLASVHQIARYAALGVDSVQKVLYDKLTKEKREQELVALEEQMIAKSNRLKSRIDSVDNVAPDRVYKDGLKNIKTTADKELGDYSSMKETDIKLNRARKLVDCFTQLDSLVLEVAALPDYIHEIQTTYQDAVWNPFMATVMKEDVKKRIPAAYRKVLIPYFLRRMRIDLSCANAKDLLAKMESTYERMLQLRDEDTRKLERKLRKEQDPEVVMQLFGLEPLTKEN